MKSLMTKKSLLLLSGLAVAAPALAQDASSVATVDTSSTAERLSRVGLTLGSASILQSKAATQMQFGAEFGTRMVNPQLDLGVGIRYFGEAATASRNAVALKASGTTWTFLPNASYVAHTPVMEILVGAQAGLVSSSVELQASRGSTLAHASVSANRFGVGPRVELLVPATDILSVSAGADYLAVVDAKDLLNFAAGLNLKF